MVDLLCWLLIVVIVLGRPDRWLTQTQQVLARRQRLRARVPALDDLAWVLRRYDRSPTGVNFDDYAVIVCHYGDANRDRMLVVDWARAGHPVSLLAAGLDAGMSDAELSAHLVRGIDGLDEATLRAFGALQN